MEPRREVQGGSSTPDVAPVGLLPAAAAGLRAATAAECQVLARDTAAQERLFARHVEFLAGRMPDPSAPTMAWIRARACLARAQAAASELAAGRALVRTAEIPLQMVQQAELLGHELVLLDAGEIRGLVVLDPARQPAWAIAWEAYRPVQRKERESRAAVFQMPTGKPGVPR